MTEDFKKGLATGLAIGGITVVNGGEDCIKIGEPIIHPTVIYTGTTANPQIEIGGPIIHPAVIYTRTTVDPQAEISQSIIKLEVGNNEITKS